MTPCTWTQEYPELAGRGADSWIGESPAGHRWMVIMWFQDETDEPLMHPYAIELSKEGDDRYWHQVTYDELPSRQAVLETFAQMKATLD